MRTSGSAEGLYWYAVHVFGKTTKKPCDVGRSRMDVNRLSKKAEAVKQPRRKKCGRRHPRREDYVKRGVRKVENEYTFENWGAPYWLVKCRYSAVYTSDK